MRDARRARADIRRDAPIALAIALLTAWWIDHAVAWVRGPRVLGAARAPSPGRQVPVEVEGQGLACVEVHAAVVARLEAFDRVCPAPSDLGASLSAGRWCGHMSAPRRLLLGAALDGRTASVRDLEVLPGVGEVIARRLRAAIDGENGSPIASPITNANASGPAHTRLGPLLRVRGIGRTRAGRLARLLALDGTSFRDICSMGLWPTTSSGSGRLR
jgi:hypothetical protein